MILVLCHPEDEGALRVASSLRRRKGALVKVVAGAELALARRWSHALADDSIVPAIDLADGTDLMNPMPRIVLNRLWRVEAPHFASSGETNRNYVQAEFTALLVDWLASLPVPVINPPSPRGMAGAWRSTAEWLVLAGKAGVPTRGHAMATSGRNLPARGWWRFPTTPGTSARRNPAAHLPGRSPAVEWEPVEDGQHDVLVVGDRVVGDLPGRLAEACRNLAGAAECPLLGVTFARSPSGALLMEDATPLPALAGRDAIEAVTDMLLGW